MKLLRRFKSPEQRELFQTDSLLITYYVNRNYMCMFAWYDDLGRTDHLIMKIIDTLNHYLYVGEAP